LKIIHIEQWSEHLGLVKPYRIANRTISDTGIHFIKLQTDTGLTGYGAASPSHGVTGEDMTDCAAALDQHLETLLLGKELKYVHALARNLQNTLKETPAALAAADMALYDLAGKALQVPVVKLLGQCHESLPTSITIGIKSIDEAVAEAEEYLARGFKILKLKVGDSIEEDVALLNYLREKAGPHAGIRVDANQGYSVDELLDFLHRTRHLNLELIEQPLQVADDKEIHKLSADLRCMLAGDESICGVEDALQYTHSPQPFGIYNIKLMKCGGITPALRMASMAGVSDIKVMWGCNDESCLSIAAALHAALASRATSFLDLDGSLDLARDLFKGGFVLHNGCLRINDAPGLGADRVD